MTSGPGTLATGFTDLRPLDTPSGQVRAWDPNLRPQFTQQWNVFVERLVTPSMSANVGYVGHKATHLVAPVEGNQPLPGVGDPLTWAKADQRRPLYGALPLVTNIAIGAIASPATRTGPTTQPGRPWRRSRLIARRGGQPKLAVSMARTASPLNEPSTSARSWSRAKSVPNVSRIRGSASTAGFAGYSWLSATRVS